VFGILAGVIPPPRREKGRHRPPRQRPLVHFLGVPQQFGDPRYWRQRAIDARAQTERMTGGGGARDEMRLIAEVYDRIAERVERRLRDIGPKG
jgi:hypothetical protein